MDWVDLPLSPVMENSKLFFGALSFKCGTTWTQEMVWQISNNVDLEGGKKPLDVRFPFLEGETLWDFQHQLPGIKGKLVETLLNGYGWWLSLTWNKPKSWLGYKNTVDFLDNASGQRFIKTHFPLSLLPSTLLTKAKVIYVARNPKDAMVSFYHHHKLMHVHGYVGDLPSFARRFMSDQIVWNPYFKHLDEAWALKENPNLLFIFYEDMKQDLNSVIRKVCEFLEVSLNEEQINKLIDHLDIKNFRNNPAVNMEIGKDLGLFSREGNFIRKGQNGGWKEEFAECPELENEFNNWIDNQMKISNVQFPD